MVQILEQSQCTGYLSLAVLLKAKTQGDGERRADHGDHDDPVIVLNIGSHLAVHLVLNFPLHAGVATADEGTADLDAIDRRHHQPSGPIGTENSVAFQAAGDFAAERKHRLGRLSLERVADGVVADRADAFGQCSLATFGLDLKQAGNLHGGAQEDGVKHLLPWVLGKLPALGQSAHQHGEAKYFIEIGLQAVPGHPLAGFLFFEKALQVETADGRSGGVKTPTHLNFLAYSFSQTSCDVESFRLAVDEDGNLELGMEVLAVGAMTVGLAAGALPFDKRAGQHLAEGAKTANEFAAQLQIGIGGCFHMTLIIVSESDQVKPPRRFARMPENQIRLRSPVNKGTGADAFPSLRNHCLWYMTA